DDRTKLVQRRADLVQGWEKLISQKSIASPGRNFGDTPIVPQSEATASPPLTQNPPKAVVELYEEFRSFLFQHDPKTVAINVIITAICIFGMLQLVSFIKTGQHRMEAALLNGVDAVKGTAFFTACFFGATYLDPTTNFLYRSPHTYIFAAITTML